ncbi:hypothetical protein J6590_091432 [Homalodisca vitripennis]|nr:hypothetical protein J6590_091432 [Homalodisca vitripennis]
MVTVAVAEAYGGLLCYIKVHLSNPHRGLRWLYIIFTPQYSWFINDATPFLLILVTTIWFTKVA